MTPSPFVVQWVPTLSAGAPPAGTALDVAMGSGRHVEPLAAAGYKVFGVDVSFSRVQEAKWRAAETQSPLLAWCADLTAHPLPQRRFDLVVVTRYLQRDLCAAMRRALRPGGLVLYETFTRHQMRHGWGPTSPQHLLEPGELRLLFEPFELIFYQEVDEPEAVARLVARRPIERAG
jgi:SAM-dependent methyltransferase